MATITNISAREILNSKGNPTVEATVVLADGSTGIAACPSGTSAGSHEALELHDGDNQRFSGHGVLRAVNNIEKSIAPKLVGMEPYDQAAIDKVMIEVDGTENKSHLGANALLSVSMAIAKAAAISVQKPLYRYLHEQYKILSQVKDDNTLRIPTPIFNVINGGMHGSGSLDFQEFILVPDRKQSYTQSLTMGVTIYQSLKQLCKLNQYSTLVGDEGGFEPHLKSNYNALDFLSQAIDNAGFQLGADVSMGLDAASNSFFHNQQYHIKDTSKPLSATGLIDYYQKLIDAFPIHYLEDLLAEDDWSDWVLATKQLGKQRMIVGDDLTVTNPKRLQRAIHEKAITAILIKPNQIGTVTEAMQVTKMAQESGLKTIVSHRSGETNDDFIADFGMAVQSDYVKFGAPARGERVAKYNRLLQIEKELEK